MLNFEKFWQEESLEKDKASKLAFLMRENKELQNELSLLAQQQTVLEREIFELSAKRDARAREYAKVRTSLDTGKQTQECESAKG